MPDLMDTHIENRWIVHPNHANNYETAHGGNVMKWMDEAGALAATRFAGRNCVTARMERVDFERPIPVGDVALVEAYVYEAGETSAKTRVRTFRENPRTRERERTTESYFVYVAVDEELRPTPVPELTVGSEEGRELREAAREGEAAIGKDRQGN